MFHTNKMPKIIVFRVVIEGTAPTEGPPTACHGKRPSCPKRAQRPPSHPAPNTSACIQLPHLRKPFSGAYLRPSAYPATGNALPVPSTPSARLLIQPRTPERLHPASPPVKAIFGRIFAPVCLSSHRKRPSCPEHPERPPSHPAPNARASASSFATCESHFRAHICARLQFQAAPPMSRLQLQAACLCQPAWSACVSP